MIRFLANLLGIFLLYLWMKGARLPSKIPSRASQFVCLLSLIIFCPGKMVASQNSTSPMLILRGFEILLMLRWSDYKIFLTIRRVVMPRRLRWTPSPFCELHLCSWRIRVS
eukprot:Rmarinus@m.14859